jgi:hypothetical protein
MSLTVDSSDIVYLAPGQSLKGYVSESTRKYKIYEFYINGLQFPESEDEAVDLFVTLTPCVGKFNFFISDTVQGLFTYEAQLQVYSHITTLNLGKRNEPTVVRHKISKVSAQGASSEHPFEEVRELDHYKDSFRI